MSNSASSSEFSRDLAIQLFGEKKGRSTSAVISDWVADFFESLGAQKPSREAVMPWVHFSMIAGAVLGGAYIVSRTDNSR